MPTYTVLYGGQQHIEAATEVEAYQQFWAWLIQQAQAGNVGLVVDSEETVPRAVAVIDLGAGGTVVCDGCNKDFSASDEPGGVLIGRAGYGPCCANEQIKKAIMQQYWDPAGFTVTVNITDGMSFRQFMRSWR